MRPAFFVILVAALPAGCAAPALQSGGDDAAVVPLGDDDLGLPATDDGGADDLARPANPHDLSRAGGSDGGGDVDAGGPPRTWGSPGVGPAIFDGGYAAPYRVTLAADAPDTIIYYTTDGTTPTLGATHAQTPVANIDVMASLTLRYFGVRGAAQEAPHSDAYILNSSTNLTSKAGYVTMDTTLDGVSPVAVVAPGQVLASAQTTFGIWYQSGGCSGGTFPCSAQLVYGVDTTDQGCLFDGGAFNFANSSLQTKTFTVTAPMTLGVHEVRVAHIEELTCANAMAMQALKTRPNVSRIGILVVQ